MSFYFTNSEIPKLSLRQRLRIAVFGSVLISYKDITGRGAVPVYVVKCSRHGLYLDFPHGYSEHFCCRACLAELQIKESRRVRA